MGKTNSLEQCASSDSVHEESFGRSGQDKAALFMSNPELSATASQAEITQPIVQFPYAYSDPYYGGLFTAYGPHNMIQPQVMAAASGRVPLPVDLPEDGPIYVNAKQYHGILRRRQTRAKLEAQNKLVKARKPYLHESRHQHALNRVRGSGGRFLSTKKAHQAPSSSQSDEVPDTFSFNPKINALNESGEHQIEANKYVAPPASDEGIAVSAVDAVQLVPPPEGRFSSMASHMPVPMQGSGGLVYNGNRHYASIVR